MIYIGKCCGEMCSKSCKCCGEGCQKFCSECWQCRCCPDYAKLPFSTCSIVFSILLAIPAVIIFLYTIGDTSYNKHCDYSYIAANVVAFFNYVIDIIFVIYAVKRIGEGYYKAFEKENNPNSISGEVCRFIGYDIFFLIFVVLFIFSFIWDIIILAWANNDNAYCENNYGGILSATKFMGGWHIAMMIVGVLLFCLIFCLLSLGENKFAKPFLSLIVCGLSEIEKEKQRRKQKAKEADIKNKNNNEPVSNHKRMQAYQLPSNPQMIIPNQVQKQMIINEEEKKLPTIIINDKQVENKELLKQDESKAPVAINLNLNSQSNTQQIVASNKNSEQNKPAQNQNTSENKKDLVPNVVDKAKDAIFKIGESIFKGNKKKNS